MQLPVTSAPLEVPALFGVQSLLTEEVTNHSEWQQGTCCMHALYCRAGACIVLQGRGMYRIAGQGLPGGPRMLPSDEVFQCPIPQCVRRCSPTSTPIRASPVLAISCLQRFVACPHYAYGGVYSSHYACRGVPHCSTPSPGSHGVDVVPSTCTTPSPRSHHGHLRE